MRIGFDFDNTIVNYDPLFHKVALEKGVIDDSVPINKIAARDYLRLMNQEDIWTDMQGYVYGARILEASSYLKAIDVMKQLKAAGHTLMIISHKTQYPYFGEPYDLHAAARAWISANLYIDGSALVDQDAVFFRKTKEDKINCIIETGCDVFIDDLPEVLTSPLFPYKTKRYLFDPDQRHQLDQADIQTVSSWAGFASHLL